MVESAGILIGLILLMSFIGILDFLGLYKDGRKRRKTLLLITALISVVIATMFLLI